MVLEPGFSRTPDGRHIAQSLRAEEFRVVTHEGSPSHQQLASQHLAPPCRIPRSVVWYRAIGDEDSVYTHHAAVIMPGDEAVQLLAQGQAALLQLGKQWKCVSTTCPRWLDAMRARLTCCWCHQKHAPFPHLATLPHRPGFRACYWELQAQGGAPGRGHSAGVAR